MCLTQEEADLVPCGAGQESWLKVWGAIPSRPCLTELGKPVVSLGAHPFPDFPVFFLSFFAKHEQSSNMHPVSLTTEKNGEYILLKT